MKENLNDIFNSMIEELTLDILNTKENFKRIK